jgi:hypothetical protein
MAFSRADLRRFSGRAWGATSSASSIRPTGLLGGGFLVLLAVAIALPVPLHAGVAALKENMVVIVPVVVDAMKGGNRKTDPPAEPPKKPDVMPGEGGPI